VAKRHLAGSKLNSIGYMKAHSSFANNPERAKQIRGELELADSLKFTVLKRDKKIRKNKQLHLTYRKVDVSLLSYILL
jgi:hypothetical protein